MRVPRVRSRPMSENKTQYTIAVIPGDGIGKEVTPWAQQALEKAAGDATQFTYVDFDLGAERYLRDGEILPDEDLERIKGTDAILLGAVGDPRVKAGVLERGLLLKLRFALDQYVNLRPSKLYKGVTSPLAEPGEIDFVVVREGTEGLYCGAGGAIRKGTEHEVATEVSINTAYGVERVVRYAFDLAMKRRKHVTLVHKKNVLVNAGDMWQRIVDRVGREYPEVSHDYCHIDAATIYMVSDPSRFDVILTDNLFGDILTDEAGAVVGGVGYSASGCINACNEFPSMFEPIHGSAPDIAGKGIANPTAAILSAAMLLRHLGFDEDAARLHAAQHRRDRPRHPGAPVTPRDRHISLQSCAACQYGRGALSYGVYGWAGRVRRWYGTRSGGYPDDMERGWSGTWIVWSVAGLTRRWYGTPNRCCFGSRTHPYGVPNLEKRFILAPYRTTPVWYGTER